MKTEKITVQRHFDFERLETFINYYLFGQFDLPKLNPYKEYILTDLLLEFLANYSEEIKIFPDAEKLYLIKVLNLFLVNAQAENIQSLNDCYDKSYVKREISHYAGKIENEINTKLEIFTLGKEQEVYADFSSKKNVSLEILTFLIHQFEGILSYVPQKSCSIPAQQYQKIIDKFLADHHQRSALFEALKNNNIEN